MQNLRKLPVGIQTFEDLRRNDYVYVDKTDLVYHIANFGKPYFLSRPRRFGKTFSLLKCFSKREFSSYWFESATPTVLIKTLENNAVDLSIYSEEIETTETRFKNYEPENANVLPIVYQSGYLTIKKYDRESGLYTLGIPNKEVRDGLSEILEKKLFKTALVFSSAGKGLAGWK